MNILDEIILFKKLEVAERKREWSISDLEKSKLYQRPIYSLVKSLQVGNATGIIAEFKRRSPSKGTINANADVEQVTKAYTKFGASALSILTDEKFFGGMVPDMMKARVNKIPILRKDFIIDEYQVIASKSFGADAILLIAACLSVKQVKTLAAFAKKTGLETLLEIHNEKELDHICDEVDIIGINNRDLKTFTVNTDTSLQLIGRVPGTRPVITESGINSVETVLAMKQAGFKGFLVGETFMKENDPGQAFEQFVNKLKQSSS